LLCTSVFVLATPARLSFGNGTGKKNPRSGIASGLQTAVVLAFGPILLSAMRWVSFHSTHPTKKEKKK
jgi:hypothetical protein